MRSTCEKYSQINVPYQNKNILKDLYNNKSIIILQLDKGRAVVIMDRQKYFEKVFDLWNTEKLLNYRTIQPIILKKRST